MAKIQFNTERLSLQDINDTLVNVYNMVTHIEMETKKVQVTSEIILNDIREKLRVVNKELTQKYGDK